MTIGLILNDRRRYDWVTKRGVVIWIVEEKKIHGRSPPSKKRL